MAENFFFFNSVEGDPREYSQDQLSQAFKHAAVGNGISPVSGSDPLAVSREPDGSIVIQPGALLVEGFCYVLDAPLVLSSPLYLQGTARCDRVVVRLDRSAERRSIGARVSAGADGSQTPPALERSGNLYEMCLAEIRHDGTAQVVTDTRSDGALCGYLGAQYATAAQGIIAQAAAADVSALRGELGIGAGDRVLAVAHGGTGASDAAAARASLGVPPTGHASASTTYGRATAGNYGHAMAGAVVPKMAGAAAVGTDDGRYARADHTHPTDDSRASVAQAQAAQTAADAAQSTANAAKTIAEAALPAASYTAADVLDKLSAVDGEGSGLDADLLDGQQGSYYATAAALGEQADNVDNMRADGAINKYTHTRTGTVHNFTGSGVNGRAKITAAYQNGDTFAVNGTACPAYIGTDTVNELPNGHWVTFTYDGSALDFKGGGAGLAVRVVGGTTQPTNPQENTVWVNTAEPITGWDMWGAYYHLLQGRVTLLTRAGNPTEPYVFLVKRSGQGSPNILVTIAGAYQYVNGVWVQKSVMIFRNGVWRTPDSVLFDQGSYPTPALVPAFNFFTRDTSKGGYAVAGNRIVLYTNMSNDSGNQGGASAIYTEPIDVTGYRTLEATVTNSGPGNMYNRAVQMGLTSETAYGWGTKWVAVGDLSWLDSRTPAIDISAISGFHRIMIGSRTDNTGITSVNLLTDIYNITLRR